jgi:hypothetical protein
MEVIHRIGLKDVVRIYSEDPHLIGMYTHIEMSVLIVKFNTRHAIKYDK